MAFTYLSKASEFAGGTLYDWLTFIAAALAGGAALFLLCIEARRDGRAAAEKRSAQAAKVVAWLPETDSLSPIVKNGSDLPVYQAAIRLYAVSEDGSETLKDFTNIDIGVLAPGEPPRNVEVTSAVIATRLLKQMNQKENYVEPGKPVETVLTFRDAAGVSWRRDLDGTLSELKE